jgi:hypothetical protein
MKLKNYKEEYQWFSSKTSDVARQLSFAGIAIIWLFRIVDESGSKIPNELMIPTIALCTSLGSDLLQYIVGSLAWGGIFKYHEMRGKTLLDEQELSHSIWFTVPIYLFFIVKLIAVIVAFTLIINYLWDLLLK